MFHWRIQVTEGIYDARHVSVEIIVLKRSTKRSRSSLPTLQTLFLRTGCEQAELRVQKKKKTSLTFFFSCAELRSEQARKRASRPLNTFEESLVPGNVQCSARSVDIFETITEP